ncbi:GntR family transcriptional regulator YhfZ [Atopococcus tabaci]|uniref:GntR family transcriptional regulator YhfZ n=1 Tax=Atopococcus tabaci TaxID=269774 RepID=UPI002409F11A|nr:GntR family transcriptional regulator YhfZ [Atopococcus tabaci]
MAKSFYQKTGIAIEQIASDLFLLEVGDRIPNVSTFQEKYALARGTVQNALRYLKEEQAIETISKGHLGTFLVHVDHGKLQHFANADQLKGTMPLPYSKLYEGLATGVYLLFKKQRIKLSMAYIRGSEERIQAVREGVYDFAVTSRFAAENVIQNHPELVIVKAFGKESYLSRHVLLLAEGNTEIQDGMRIGIDSDSLDHSVLTKTLVKDKRVELVEMPSNQLIYALREKQIDAGIWNYDEIEDKQVGDLHYKDIEEEQYHQAMSEAVVICRADRKMICSICEKYLSTEKIREIQRMIKEGAMTPRY